jgi:steroid delta-isomerase-like uncharacterized protein
MKDPVTIARAWFERVWNQGDEEAIDELFSPTGIAHGLPVQPNGKIAGPQEFKRFANNFRAAFPNIRIAIRHCIVQGDLCAVHCDVTGTHTGEGLGLPATGRTVRFSGMCIIRVANDQIEEGWNSFDFLSLYQQLGALPILNQH